MGPYLRADLQWIQNLPTWLGHVAFGIMFLAAVAGIIKVRPQDKVARRVAGNVCVLTKSEWETLRQKILNREI